MATPLETIYLFGFALTFLLFVFTYDRILGAVIDGSRRSALVTKIVMEITMVLLATAWPLFWGLFIIRSMKRG